MNDEKPNINEQVKLERLDRIKDYFVLFQWLDKFLDPNIELKDVTTIDFSKIEESINKEIEGV